MISLFKYYNITPIFVFDGTPPIEKQKIIEQRRELKREAYKKWDELNNELNIADMDIARANEILEEMDKEKKKFVKITKNDVQDIKNLMDAYGVSYIDAEGEADELCAKLVQKKIAYGCLSEDMDLFVYGTTRVFRYLSLLNSTIVVYNLKDILHQLELSLKEFKEICVVSGTDYNIDSEDNYNIYQVLKMFRKYKKTKEEGFYHWLQKNNKVRDINLLNKIYNMFDISTVKLTVTKNHLNLKIPIWMLYVKL